MPGRASRFLHAAVGCVIFVFFTLASGACTLDFDRFRGAPPADSNAAGKDGGQSAADASESTDAGHSASNAGNDASSGQGGAGAGGMNASPDASTDAAQDAGSDASTRCSSDGDCASHVCEELRCVQCRSRSECDADELCIELHCVPDRKPSSIWFSAGGGLSSATGFKLRVSLGSPEPMGQASAVGFKVSIGPALRTP